jgi:EpsI family protein
MSGAERQRWIAAGMVGAAVVALFQFFGNPVRGYIDTVSLFYWWAYQWNNPASETEHGWLVLGLSGWLLGRNLRRPESGDRKADGATPAEEAGKRAADEVPESDLSGFRIPVSGFAALVAGLALHAVGFVAQQTRVSIGAFLLCTWGVLRIGGGRRWGGAAVFPLVFMLFAVPINVLDSIGFWLRVWVVDASGAIARAAGIAVLQSGTQLVAPDGKYNYDVAAACSGIRSLTAMAALSLLAGYLNFRGTGRRVLVLLLCFPLVYVGNVARIVAIVFAAEAGGPTWGDVAHDVMGYGIFAIVLGGVLAEVWALRRWWPEEDEGISDLGLGIAETGDRNAEAGERRAEGEGDGVVGNPQSAIRNPKSVLSAWLVAGGIVALVAGEMVFLHGIANRAELGAAGVRLAADGRDPVELPRFLGIEWTGRPQPVSAAEKEILPPDTGYSRKLYFNHRDPAKQVFLSIVLSGRDRSSIHRPELCLVGQGWTVAEGRQQVFRLAGAGGASFPVTVLPVRREVQTAEGKRVVPQLVVYWFVGSEVVVASHWKRVLLDAWNRVTRGRADRWAYVLMQTEAADGEAAALARVAAVLEATWPEFQQVWTRSGGAADP